MQEIRANTQVIVPVGPFVDVGDGFTPETGITLGSADEAELLKHGSTTVTSISGATWAAITSMDGYYALTLTTSHTDTLGMLTVAVHDDSVCLPVKAEFMVLSEEAWDSKYVGNTNVVDRGTAQAGAAGTLTLAATASTTADIYNGMTVYIYAGTGAGQSRVIHDYSAGRVASVSPDWTTTPSTDSEYTLYPTAPANQSEPAEVNVTQISGSAVSTASAQLGVNVVQISADATAADNLEAAYDGTGYDVGGIDVSELNQIVDDLINGGRLDLLIDAIKAKTDQLTFTVSNQVDANMESINATGLTGDGTSGTEWGPV